MAKEVGSILLLIISCTLLIVDSRRLRGTTVMTNEGGMCTDTNGWLQRAAIVYYTLSVYNV